MQTSQKLRPITRLPAGWPSKGMMRSDFGDYIVLAHPDRHPHYSTDGKNWKQVDLADPKDNAIAATFERQRWAR